MALFHSKVRPYEINGNPYSKFRRCQKEWIDFCLSKGIEIPEPQTSDDDTSRYSGKFTIRVGKTIHQQLVERSRHEDLSVNALVNNFIVSGLRNANTINEIKDLVTKNIGNTHHINLIVGDSNTGKRKWDIPKLSDEDFSVEGPLFLSSDRNGEQPSSCARSTFNFSSAQTYFSP